MASSNNISPNNPNSIQMNYKVILLFCLLALTGKAYTQESSDVVTANDIIQVVQKANLTLNIVCREYRQDADVMQKRIIKEIYSTNDVLFSIRDMVDGQRSRQWGKTRNVSNEVNALYTSLSPLNDTLSNQSLLDAISDIKQKAIQLRRKLK